MNKINKKYICQESSCNLETFHNNHTCLKFKNLECYYNNLFNQNIILDNNFYFTQIQLLKETLDKIKSIFQSKLLIHQDQYNFLLNQYQQQHPNWKILAQNVEIGQNGLKLKIDCAEILYQVSDLVKLCQNFYNENKPTKRPDCKIKIKVNVPIYSQTIEEEIQLVEIRAKQQELISVGNATEKKIISLQQLQSDSILILFDNNSLFNYNLQSKCSRQEVIKCQKFHLFDNKLVVQYNKLNHLYYFDQQRKTLQQYKEFQVIDVIWCQLREKDMIYQKSNFNFYKKLFQNNLEIEILQLNLNVSTVNYLVDNKLAIFFDKTFIIYELNLLPQVEWQLKINDNIQEIKQNTNNYLVLIGKTKFYMISLVKKSLVQTFDFQHLNTLIIPSPQIPYLFLIATSGNVYESKTYFHNTKQPLCYIISQHPTAISMDNQTILIGDDLGFIQKFRYSLE